LQVARVTSRHWPSTTEAWLRWKDSSARLFLKLPLNNYTSRLRRAADPKTIARTRNLFTSKGQTIMKKLILLLNFAALITTGAFQTSHRSNSIQTAKAQPKTGRQNHGAEEEEQHAGKSNDHSGKEELHVGEVHLSKEQQ